MNLDEKAKWIIGGQLGLLNHLSPLMEIQTTKDKELHTKTSQMGTNSSFSNKEMSEKKPTRRKKQVACKMSRHTNYNIPRVDMIIVK